MIVQFERQKSVDTSGWINLADIKIPSSQRFVPEDQFDNIVTIQNTLVDVDGGA
jgi:hypothetical protein